MRIVTTRSSRTSMMRSGWSSFGLTTIRIVAKRSSAAIRSTIRSFSRERICCREENDSDAARFSMPTVSLSLPARSLSAIRTMIFLPGIVRLGLQRGGPPYPPDRKSAASGLPASRSDPQSDKDRLQIRRASGCEEFSERGLDHGAVARPLGEREVANFASGEYVERDRETRVARVIH